jgi:hypothetical protein
MIDRGRLTQIASAAAVALSLVFVGLEVRESAQQTELNTQSLQVSTYQDLVAQLNGIQTLMLENPDLSRRVQEKYDYSWDDLSAAEQAEFRSLAFLLLRHGDLAFYQYELGMLTEDRLWSVFGSLRGILFCRPAFRAFWDSERDSFTEGYQQFISDRYSEQYGC